MSALSFNHCRLMLFGLASIGGVIATLMLGTNLTWQLWFLVPLVALLGLPHGCLDVSIAMRLRPLPTALSVTMFVALYLVLAGLVLGLWLVLPGFALALFLGYSALHFAGDWRRYLPGLKSLPLGLTIVALPAVAFHAETLAILAILAPEAWASRLTDAMVLIALTMGSLGLCLLLATKAPWVQLVEYLGLIAIGLLTPPLVYFTLYFCLAHSPKHLMDTKGELGMSTGQLFWRALPIWLVTIVGAVVAFSLLAAPPQAATLQIIFIGLAALTVPHMLLVEAMWLAPRPGTARRAVQEELAPSGLGHKDPL